MSDREGPEVTAPDEEGPIGNEWIAGIRSGLKELSALMAEGAVTTAAMRDDARAIKAAVVGEG